MSGRRSIAVLNQTGETQEYSVIAAGLLVSGGVSGTIKLNVMFTSVVPPAQIVQFQIPVTFWAVSGNYRGDKLAVNKAVPISLGSQSGMGSTVALSVINREVPDVNETSPSEGKIGNFQLSSKSKSGTEFTFEDAAEKRFFVGLAGGEDSEFAAKTVLGTFTPRPNARYQVMSPGIFHVATGESLKQGQVVKIEDLENTMAVNFEARGTNDVTLIHDKYNNFVFKAA